MAGNQLVINEEKQADVAGAATAAGRATRVMRPAVFAFFVGYHCFTSVAAVLVLPFLAVVLASEVMMAPLSSSGTLRVLAARLRAVFTAAGFPPPPFFTLLEAKLSQTVFTFTLTFLLLAKICIAPCSGTTMASGHLGDVGSPSPLPSPSPSSRRAGPRRAYPAVVATHLLSAFLMLSANAAVFSLLLLLAFDVADLLGLTSHF